MINRAKVHFVGSIPLNSAEEVFRRCSESVGSLVATLPDGETGNRAGYIIYVGYTIFRPHPDVVVTSEPLPVDPDDPEEWRSPDLALLPRHNDLTDMWRFSLKEGVTELHLETMGYAEPAIESYQVFRRLRDEGVIPGDVRFQVSLPGAMDVVGTMVGKPEEVPIFASGYEMGMSRDLAQIIEAIPAADLAIQWDTVTNCLEHEMEKVGQQFPYLAGAGTPTERFRGTVSRFAAQIPAEVGLGLHFCYGSVGDAHPIDPADLSVPVRLANEAVDAIDRRVDWIHMPVPHNRDDTAYFEPLNELNDQPHLFLGLVHVQDGVEGTVRRIRAAQQYRNNFGISTECGFGRRDPATIPDLIDVHARAAEALDAQ